MDNFYDFEKACESSPLLKKNRVNLHSIIAHQLDVIAKKRMLIDHNLQLATFCQVSLSDNALI
jgi:hypothetical protein